MINATEDVNSQHYKGERTKGRKVIGYGGWVTG